MSRDQRKRSSSVGDPGTRARCSTAALPRVHWACVAGRSDVAQWLLEHGADPDARTAAGRTPLHGAVAGAHVDVVASLLARGADRAVPDRFGQTAAQLVKRRAAALSPLPERAARLLRVLETAGTP